MSTEQVEAMIAQAQGNSYALAQMAIEAGLIPVAEVDYLLTYGFSDMAAIVRLEASIVMPDNPGLVG